MPPPDLGSSPCLIAFSTSVCSIIVGNGTDLSASGTLICGLQARAHADLHDVEVGAHALEFLAQRGQRILEPRQRMAQVQDQVVDDLLRARRVAAHQVLGAAERVVEEVRLDLRVQQAQLGDRQFLLGLRLLGGRLLAAAHFGDAARDGAADRLRILEVGAVVHGEPVAPGAALGLADEVHGAGVRVRRDGREDLVALRRRTTRACAAAAAPCAP